MFEITRSEVDATEVESVVEVALPSKTFCESWYATEVVECESTRDLHRLTGRDVGSDVVIRSLDHVDDRRHGLTHCISGDAIDEPVAGVQRA